MVIVVVIYIQILRDSQRLKVGVLTAITKVTPLLVNLMNLQVTIGLILSPTTGQFPQLFSDG